MQELVRRAKIFSDINRVKILGLLLRDKEICVCEICDTLELSQPLVSRHLKQMKEAGLLSARQEGKWVLYTLHPEHNIHCFLEQVQAHIQTLPKLVSCEIK